jgi:hypothetical protein
MNKDYQPKYPIYIISKGRHESRLTSKALEKMGVPYHIVIEPQEYELYASVIDKSKILVLPFSNLNQGGIPARNWVWEHSISIGAERHWIMDDNIVDFKRLNRNKRIRVDNGAIIRAMEDFVDRYENIAMAGPEYQYFCHDRSVNKPYRENTRVYSCILIKNDTPFRWRGKYNEDTDLSLRILKAGYCTILFYAFLQNKVSTLKMKGGNTDELYKKTNNRMEFAQSLVEQHPDVAKVVWRYERWHHEVDYTPFKRNKRILKQGIVISEGVNNYGMVLERLAIDQVVEDENEQIEENTDPHEC